MIQTNDLHIRAKYTVKCRGRKVVLCKNVNESRFHVLSKAVVYAQYCENYSTLIIEPKSFGRFRPDLIGYDSADQPLFWAECGKVSPQKIQWMTKKYRAMHFVFVKRAHQTRVFQPLLKKSIDTRFKGIIELIAFPDELLETTQDQHTIDLDGLKLNIQTIC